MNVDENLTNACQRAELHEGEPSYTKISTLGQAASSIGTVKLRDFSVKRRI